MKKKLLCLLLTATIAFSSTGCSLINKFTKSGPPDLTGKWKTEESDGTYQEAVITDNSIEIKWVTDSGAKSDVYWIGTYVPPKESVSEYTWTSERNKAKTDNEAFASSNDTKEFTYKNGKISYEASIEDSSATIELKKQ